MEAIAHAAARAVGGTVVPWLRSKPDHGDADVILPESMRRDDATTAAAVAREAGLAHIVRRDSKENPILFVGLETPRGLFQVDLIHWADETADFCRRFLSWGDAGSMVGIVAREMGLKFGMDVLRVPVRAPAAPLGSVLLTADFDTALDHLGLDPAAHRDGFDDDAATAAWIGRGRYHDPKLYDPMRTSSDARRRGRARRGREDHLAMLRAHPANHEWPEVKGDSDMRRAMTMSSIARFGARDAFDAEIRRIEAMKRDQKLLAFSMDLVASIIGATGRDVKATINIMRELWFSEPYSFSRWKEHADEAEVRDKVTKAHAELRIRRAEEAERAARHAEQLARAERNRATRGQGQDV